MNVNYYVIYSACGRRLLSKIAVGSLVGGINLYLGCDHLLGNILYCFTSLDNSNLKCPQVSVQKIKLTCWGVYSHHKDDTEIARSLVVKFKAKDNQ